MHDFSFLHNTLADQWVILAPHRAARPDQGTGRVAMCPFCPGTEGNEQELYRIKGNKGESVNTEVEKSNWKVRVLGNKYPFAPIHEVIIHSQDHHKNFDELPLEGVQDIIQCYKDRYNTHRDKGSVYIFHNFGQAAGESLSHPHSQLVVIPKEVTLRIPPLPNIETETQKTSHFTLFAPKTSQWPDEVWITPVVQNSTFGELTDLQQVDLAFTVKRLIEIFSLRHGQEFPFNFYIYPYRNWYIRMIPRIKRIGGFEIGTDVYVNTQDPLETISFIKEHFVLPNREKILKEHQAKYHKGV